MKEIAMKICVLLAIVPVLCLNMPLMAGENKSGELTDEQARIIFEIHDIYGTGIGAQLLFDADHDIWGGTLAENDDTFPQEAYTEFEYTVPEQENPVFGQTDVLVDGIDTIVIPAGTYDYVCVLPMNEGLVIVHHQGSSLKENDFVFEGGNTYRFRVELVYDELGWGNQPQLFLQIPYDMGLDSLKLPESGMDLSDNETISVYVSNRGKETVSSYDLCYRIGEDAVVRESCRQELLEGEGMWYSFAAKADFSSEGKHRVSCWVEYGKDMDRSNDTVSGICFHPGIAEVPYHYDFVSEEDFSFDWLTIDANQDQRCWEWKDLEDTTKIDGAAGIYMSYGKADDYLVSGAIRLKKGKNYISFQISGIETTGSNPGEMEVWYGKSREIADMVKLDSFSVHTVKWRLRAIQLDEEKEEVYYFAFRARSQSSSYLQLDNILVDAGTFDFVPEPEIEDLLLPVSNCNLSDQVHVGVSVANVGMGQTDTLTFVLSVDGSEVAAERAVCPIGMDEVYDYYFDHAIDLSGEGTYDISVEVGYKGDDISLQKSVSNFPPVLLPAETEFGLQESVSAMWNELEPGSWRMGMSEYFTIAVGLQNALVSRCMSLSEGFYQIDFSCRSSNYENGSFTLLIGKAGCELSELDTLFHDEQIPYDEWRYYEKDVRIDEPGEYNIWIVNDRSCGLCLNSFGFRTVYDYDVELVSAFSDIAAYTPFQHTKGQKAYTVLLRNIGLKTVTGSGLSLFAGEKKQFSVGKAFSLEPGEEKRIDFYGSLSVDECDTIRLHVEVEADQEDGDLSNNRRDLKQIVITDTVMAMENMRYGTGIGQNDTECGFGNIFSLSETDTLTAVEVGLAFDMSGQLDNHLKIGVFKLKEGSNEIDYQIYSLPVLRPLGGRIYRYEMPYARVLEAGRYYVEVYQQSACNAMVMSEVDENSRCFMRQGDSLFEMDVNLSLLIRAVLNEGYPVKVSDVSVNGFVSPSVDSALFSKNEKLEVEVENRGASLAENIVLNCSGQGNGAEKAFSLRPYEKTTVDLGVADLYAAGDYSFRVEAVLEGDEDLSNNVLEKVFHTYEIEDRGFLDFELCQDFDTGTFNREWKSVKFSDAESTDGLWGFVYPYIGEPVGFMAFNVDAVEKEISGASIDIPGNMKPYEGKRSGVVFTDEHTTGTSDVWLISPKMKLGSEARIELYALSSEKQTASSEMEPFQIWVSETDAEKESFEKVGDLLRAPFEWTEFTQDLSAYAGKEVYVGIQYLGEPLKNFFLMLDNIRITTGLSVSDPMPVSDDWDVKAFVSNGRKILLTGTSPVVGVEIFDLRGTRVYENRAIRGVRVEIDASEFSGGLYLCRVRTEAGVKSVKVVLL